MTRLRMTAAALVLLLGCDSDDGDNPGDGATDGTMSTAATTPAGSTTGDSGQTSADATGGGPSPDSESGCKNICDSLLSQGCIDADEHETCFLECGVRTDDEIELFESCWLNSVGCEENNECLANFLDDDAPDPTGDPDPQTCLDACNVYVGMGCQPPIEGVSSCGEFCSSLTPELQAAAVSCLDGADGCTLPQACMLPGGE